LQGFPSEDVEMVGFNSGTLATALGIGAEV